MATKDDNHFTIEQLAEAWEGLPEEISRRDPERFAAAVRDGKGTLALLGEHPDLSATFSARLDAIRERRKHLRVKVGDWVTINGSRFRIGSIDPRTGTVSTERRDRAGGLLSMDQVDGSRLFPDATPAAPEELDPVGPGSARERLDRHVRLLAGKPQPSPGGPSALQREGTAQIREFAWTTPPPPQPLSARHLARYWQWLLGKRRDRRQQLDEAPTTSPDPDGLALWRRERRIQIHHYEAVLALLHGIVAPQAPYVCGADCTHLGEGATREQLKRFRDSLAAFRADTEYESEENYTVECAEGQLWSLMQGRRVVTRLERAGLIGEVVQLMPGAEADDRFVARVLRGDEELERVTCDTEAEARATVERRLAQMTAT